MITYIQVNFLKRITNLLIKDIVPNRRWYSNHLQCTHPWVLGIFPTLTLGRTNLFYQLAIHICDNSHICLHFFIESKQVFDFSS